MFALFPPVPGLPSGTQSHSYCHSSKICHFQSGIRSPFSHLRAGFSQTVTSVAILRSPSKPFRSKGDRNTPPFRNALTTDPALASYSHMSLRASPFPTELVLFHPLLSHPLSSKHHHPPGSTSVPGFQKLPVTASPYNSSPLHGLRHTHVLATPHESNLGNIWHCSELFRVKYVLYPQLKQ